MKRTPLKAGTTGLRRTPLDRGTATLDRRKRLAPVSERRLSENEGDWTECKRIVRERDRGVCQIERFFTEHKCIPGDRTHPHHCWPVGAGGPRLDPENVATVCAIGHDWIHNRLGWKEFFSKWREQWCGRDAFSGATIPGPAAGAADESR